MTLPTSKDNRQLTLPIEIDDDDLKFLKATRDAASKSGSWAEFWAKVDEIAQEHGPKDPQSGQKMSDRERGTLTQAHMVVAPLFNPPPTPTPPDD